MGGNQLGFKGLCKKINLHVYMKTLQYSNTSSSLIQTKFFHKNKELPHRTIDQCYKVG